MNLSVIPLLIVALLMASGEPEVESVQLILSGDHQLEDHRGALIVADGEVSVPGGAQIPGPVYVIGGELTVAGVVESDVIQLAGTVRVEDGADIGDELRHIAGSLVVAPGADVGRRTSLELTSTGPGGTLGGLIPVAVSMFVLAGVGYLLAGKRSRALDHVAAALTGHPVVTLTVGLLLALTAVSVLVFMAFTLVLIPVAIVGLLAAVATLVYALAAWGRLIGGRLPVGHDRLATAIGAAGVVGGLQVVGLVPLIGDLIVPVVVLTGLGAVVVTYFGVTGFRPDVLPD